MTIGLAVVVVLSLGALALYLQQTRSQSALDECIRYMRHLQGAKTQWALENRAGPDAMPSWEALSAYRGREQPCPGGGNYRIGAVVQLPECSLPHHTAAFLERDGDEFREMTYRTLDRIKQKE